MWIDVPPFLPFFVGALLVAVTRGRGRQVLLLAVPILGGLNLIGAAPGVHLQVEWLGMALSPFRVDKLSLLFGYLFHLAALVSFVFALHLGDEDRAGLQHVSAMLYAGSALGAAFAGDLITLFVFWELLALTSVFLVWARRSERSFASGFRCLVIHVVSGVILLSGALLIVHETGSAEFGHIGLEAGLGGWLLMIAFGIKAGFPLLHNWITDAYPESTPTGTVFLSAFTTKVAVYALARGFAGTEILVYVGTVMTFFPIFYAVLENDLRRVLGYSMINQIGFMVTGIGIGTALGVNGAVAHAFADVFFKGLLFMSMGAVMQMTGRTKGTELGGLYKTMPITAAFCILGSSSISALPFLSAFVTKSMVMAAALHEGHTIVWLFLLFASAGVLEHAGIKIPYFAFFAHDSGIRAKEPPLNMLIAMAGSGLMCIAIGSLPVFFYSLLPMQAEYVPYDPTHLLTQLQLLSFGALGFVTLVKSGVYPPEKRAVHIDAEWLYRWVGPRLVSGVGGAVARVDAYARASVLELVRSALDLAGRGHGPRGPLARTWPTGSMVLWVAILLGAYLIFYL